MGFITGLARMEHTGINGVWRILDNQLFKNGNDLYIIPRNFLTDNYTIPNWITWLAGAGDDYDVRPSHFHDFGCWFHSMVKVDADLEYLEQIGIVRNKLCKDGKMRVICDDIPTQFLVTVPMKKKEVDNLFKEMMIATGNITKFTASKLRAGVFFNIGWLFTNHSIDYEKFYTGVNPDYLYK